MLEYYMYYDTDGEYGCLQPGQYIVVKKEDRKIINIYFWEISKLENGEDILKPLGFEKVKFHNTEQPLLVYLGKYIYFKMRRQYVPEERFKKALEKLAYH